MTTTRNNALTKAATLTLVGAAWWFTSAAQAKDWTSVTIATEAAYAPWNLTLPNGQIGGFEPELLADLCARLKMQCTLKSQDWDGMIPGLQAGKFDVLMDAIVITPEREKVIAFSRPYAATQGVLAAADPALIAKAGLATEVVKLSGDAQADKPYVDKLRSLLDGKTIGIQSGTAYTQFVEDNFKDIASIREYKKSGEHVLDLQAGRIDFAFDDVTFFLSTADAPERVTMVGFKIGGPIWGPGEALAFRQDTPELKAKFDEALDAALADGTVKRLSEKWFKADITP